MYPISLMQKTKEERLQGLKRTAIFLSQVREIIRSKRFLSWFDSQESRFDWASESVFGKLRKDLMFQVKQAMPDRETRDASDREQIAALSEHCLSLVQWIEENFPEAKPLKKEKQFKVPKGERFTDHLYEFLSRTYHSGLVKDTTGDFYLWNAVEALILYTRARDTLDNPVPNPAFEKVLSGLTEQYMLQGYPNDLLAHDAHDLRTGQAVTALIMQKGYCSTRLVKADEEMPVAGDADVFDLNKKARRAA